MSFPESVHSICSRPEQLPVDARTLWQGSAKQYGRSRLDLAASPRMIADHDGDLVQTAAKELALCLSGGQCTYAGASLDKMQGCFRCGAGKTKARCSRCKKVRLVRGFESAWYLLGKLSLLPTGSVLWCGVSDQGLASTQGVLPDSPEPGGLSGISGRPQAGRHSLYVVFHQAPRVLTSFLSRRIK